MNAKRIAIVAMTALVLLSPLATADCPFEELRSPCPAIQTMPHDPYVVVQPDCLPVDLPPQP